MRIYPSTVPTRVEQGLEQDKNVWGSSKEAIKAWYKFYTCGWGRL